MPESHAQQAHQDKQIFMAALMVALCQAQLQEKQASAQIDGNLLPILQTQQRPLSVSIDLLKAVVDRLNAKAGPNLVANIRSVKLTKMPSCTQKFITEIESALLRVLTDALIQNPEITVGEAMEIAAQTIGLDTIKRGFTLWAKIEGPVYLEIKASQKLREVLGAFQDFILEDPPIVSQRLELINKFITVVEQILKKDRNWNQVESKFLTLDDRIEAILNYKPQPDFEEAIQSVHKLLQNELGLQNYLKTRNYLFGAFSLQGKQQHFLYTSGRKYTQSQVNVLLSIIRQASEEYTACDYFHWVKKGNNNAFTAQEKGTEPATHHTERQLIENLDIELQKLISSLIDDKKIFNALKDFKLTFFSYNEPCPSCQGVIRQFIDKYADLFGGESILISKIVIKYFDKNNQLQTVTGDALRQYQRLNG